MQGAPDFDCNRDSRRWYLFVAGKSRIWYLLIMKKSKVEICGELLRMRIEQGDLLLKGELPSERDLTLQTGMSRTTIRKALKLLFEQGVLAREGRRRALVAGGAEQGKNLPAVAFLVPAVFSQDHGLWWDGVVTVFEGIEVILRPVSYVYFEDPIVHETISRYDGVFFIPPSKNIPRWLADKMHDAPCRIAVLDQDESRNGFVSVKLFPPASESKLMDHLVALGHQRIDCLNTQAEDAVILERISGWRNYLEKRGLTGVLRSQPDSKPLSAAYDAVSRSLREGHLLGTALFCTTGPCAVGAMRALQEAGLEVGRDISVCAVNDEGIGRYLLKSLTALESRARSLYLRPVAEWMLSDQPWKGPLLVVPRDVPLFIGESTGAAPADGRQSVSAAELNEFN